MKRKLGLAATALVLGVALALVVTACGGGGDSKGVASLTDTTSTTQGSGSGSASNGADAKDWRQAQLDYARCMREHGVDFPDPVDGRFELRSKRRDQRKTQEAQRACAHILADAKPPQLSEAQQAEAREAALEFAKCMREHGIDMPDPTFPEGGGMLMRMPKGAEDDPQFEEAQNACQPILDSAKPGRGTGKGGSS